MRIEQEGRGVPRPLFLTQLRRLHALSNTFTQYKNPAEATAHVEGVQVLGSGEVRQDRHPLWPGFLEETFHRLLGLRVTLARTPARLRPALAAKHGC